MPKKYKKRKLRKRINKSIYKSNINKQHVKVNVNTGSTPSSISCMHAPAYPNLMDINTAVKGTVEELLKRHQQQIPINIPDPPVNNSSSFSLNGVLKKSPNSLPGFKNKSLYLSSSKSSEFIYCPYCNY